MNNSWNPAQKGEHEIQKQLCPAPALQEDHERWQHEGGEKEEDICLIEVRML